MRTPLKIVAWVLVALVVLFVAGAIALTLIYPKDKLLARLVPAAEAYLGRPVELADAGISFWPPFGIYISGLTVANLPPARAPHLVRVAYGRGQLELWPLLKGDIVVAAAELRGDFRNGFHDGTSELLRGIRGLRRHRRCAAARPPT